MEPNEEAQRAHHEKLKEILEPLGLKSKHEGIFYHPNNESKEIDLTATAPEYAVKVVLLTLVA